MNLKDFLKDKKLNQITIEGQAYFKLPLPTFPNWEGVYKNISSNKLLSDLTLIGVIRKSDYANFHLIKETPEKHYFDQSFQKFIPIIENSIIEAITQKLQNIDIKPSKITYNADYYYINNITPTYRTYFEDTAVLKNLDILTYLETNSIDAILKAYLSKNLQAEKIRKENYLALTYGIEQLKNKKENEIINSLKNLLSSIKDKKTVTLTYEIGNETWVGRIKTDVFKEIRDPSMGFSCWEVSGQAEQFIFKDKFNCTTLYFCGIKEISYKNKIIYKRNDDLFIFCTTPDALSTIIGEKINRVIDNGFLYQLKKKYKKDFYYLGFQRVALLKSQWEKKGDEIKDESY